MRLSWRLFLGFVVPPLLFFSLSPKRPSYEVSPFLYQQVLFLFMFGAFTVIYHKGRDRLAWSCALHWEGTEHVPLMENGDRRTYTLRLALHFMLGRKKDEKWRWGLFVFISSSEASIMTHCAAAWKIGHWGTRHQALDIGLGAQLFHGRTSL
ncbi:hypothetical protein B0H63DRAFT_278449 [Podospora didyma]|uniref:Uncharacterized protein n=1 Tax=Podospora didyma TaxID=330526 RepID=A0AAE0KFS4_9PEZI|nr:hypothetical protein B0H63DRAFT_278449 [Podospora didyma]